MPAIFLRRTLRFFNAQCILYVDRVVYDIMCGKIPSVTLHFLVVLFVLDWIMEGFWQIRPSAKERVNMYSS